MLPIKKASASIFAAGVLFGTAGVKLLTSKDAKKFYTHCTAAILRAKEALMDTVTDLQENAMDIYEEAQQINEERAMEEFFEDGDFLFPDDEDEDEEDDFTEEDDEEEEEE